MKKMADICTEDFFNALGVAIGESDCASYIISSKSALYLHVLLNYNMPVLSSLEDIEPATIATSYFAPAYGDTIKRLFDALINNYNILANTDVTTTEEGFADFEHTTDYNSNKRKTGDDTEILSGEDKDRHEITEDDNYNFSTTYDDITVDSETKTGKPTTQSQHGYLGNNKTEYGKNTTLRYNSTESHGGDDTSTGHDENSRTIHRVGNIGITPNQRLIELELNLRLRNRFFSYIMAFLVKSFSSGLWGDDE